MKALPTRVTAYAAAKVNVGWRVGTRRPDGYHDVCGVIQTVSLADRLTIECGEETAPGDGGCLVDVEGVPVRLRADPSDLEGPDNLVVRAAGVLAGRAAPRPTSIELGKSIPIAGGLGGGSADAAATLVALNVLWGGRLHARQLVELGAEVGSDVPALVLGGLVHVTGRGERVRRVGETGGYVFVLGIGPERVSAAEAYDTFDRIGRAPSDALHANDLEAAACSIVPGLTERVEAMRDAAGTAFVSGSGPTVVGVTATPEAEAVAERVSATFDDVIVGAPTDWGVRLVMGADS